MHDLAITSATLVTPSGRRHATIVIDAGRISALLEPGAVVESRQVIDASGLLVLPGLVDAHVHLRDPGLTHKEDFASGTAAAAVGGVTTVMVMPTDRPMTTTAALLEEKRHLGEGRSQVDFALQALVGPGTEAGEVERLGAAGAISFELFLADMAAPMQVNTGAELLACLRAVAATGRVAGISAGDESIVAAHTQTGMHEQASSREAFLRSRPAVAEAMGLARALVAAEATGARVHIRQMSSTRGLAVLQALRGAGGPTSELSADGSSVSRIDVTSEVTPHNLLLDEGFVKALGPVAKVLPPLRTPHDLACLRAALRDGIIDMVATDHAPHLPAEKAAGEVDLALAPGGLAGLQTWLPLMLSMVSDRVLDESTLVRVCCEAPARRFGLWPRKGSLEPGADADLVLIDPRRPLTIRNADQLSRAAQTPFDGRQTPATPVLTLLRGEVIAREGKVVGSARGRFVAPEA
jgi:dihydroorotase